MNTLLPSTETVALPQTPTRQFQRLTAEGRAQVRSGTRKCTNIDVPVRGDADRRLVRSYEATFLVRLMESLSVRANAAKARLLATGPMQLLPVRVQRGLADWAIDLRVFAAYQNLLALVVGSVLLVLALYVTVRLARFFGSAPAVGATVPAAAARGHGSRI